MEERIVILGGGESGVGAAILAHKMGYEVFLSDGGSISASRRSTLKSLKVDFEELGHTEERILNADLVVKSPGIPDHAPIVQKLISKNVPVVSEIEFAYRFIEKAKVVAITGTNGKTTTSLLTHHLLKAAGYNAALGGNVGTSLAGLVAEGGYDYYVVEVSSFQLDGIVDFRPDVAVILNITPDHLDRYNNNFDRYVKSKFRIIENLTHEGAFIYYADSMPIAEELVHVKTGASLLAMSTSANEKMSAYLKDEYLVFNYEFKNKRIYERIPLSAMPLIGKHNLVNTMAAVLSALCLDIPLVKLLEGLKTFKNASHRLELVDEINGVMFINDSKATNVDAVYYALDGVKKDIIWIAGGIDKGNDYDQIADLVMEKVKGIVCLGKDNSKLRKYFGTKVGVFKEVDSAEGAVRVAFEMAKKGDVVMLSPACASFDLFNNYEDRGDKFRMAVKNFKKKLKEEK